MADDDASKKKAAEEAADATTVLAWPTRGYALFIPFLLVHVLVVYSVFMDVSVWAHMFRYRYELYTVNAMFLIYLD